MVYRKKRPFRVGAGGGRRHRQAGLADCGTGGENGKDQNLSFSKRRLFRCTCQAERICGQLRVCVCARHTHSSQSACLECNGIIYKGEVVGVERFCSAAGAGKEIRKAKAAREPLLPGALYNGSWLWRG